MTRLTPDEVADRAMPEATLQAMVVEIATILGWSWVHFRPGLRANGRWYVPVEGPLGKGWPDLLLVRERDARRLAVELKREVGSAVTPDQRWVLETLAACGFEIAVWRPSDLRASVAETLR